MDELLVHVRQQPGCTLVTAAGIIDAVTIARLRTRLSEALMTGRPVIADLSQVAFIDAAGLNGLAAAARHARTRHGSLHVVSDGGQVRWLITLTGLDQAIPLARTIAEAAAALSPPRGTAGKCAARLRKLRQHYALSRWR
jgi:anti-sigma B factor antagonist